MGPDHLHLAAQAVLAHYPAPLVEGSLQSLGNHGGFSGASLWRIGDTLCLRAFLPSLQEPARLTFMHILMLSARREGLHYVPTVFAQANGTTFVERAGRLWELLEWMPGRATYHEIPSSMKLQSACTALGHLHRNWERFTDPSFSLIPAVVRRMETAALGLADVSSVGSLDAARAALDRARRMLPHRLSRIPDLLAPWKRQVARSQPCLCDVWHDHLLFEGDRLTGLVDYAAVKYDHVAVDLARLLGSLVEDDDEGWRAGLVAYSRQRPLSPEDEALARVLDVTGTILGAANWMHWLSDPQRTFENRATAAQRLERLLNRIERWK